MHDQIALPLIAGLALILLAAMAGIAALAGRCALQRARADLRHERLAAEYYRMAAEHANDGLVVQTMDATIVWANPAYLRMMGRSADQVIGSNPLEFAFPPDEAPAPEAIAAFRYDPNAPQSELQLFRNIRGDGSLFWNQINIAFRRSASGEDHAILVCRDVTESVEHEETLRAMRDRLAHEASHDALTGLANRSEMMRYLDRALAAERTGGRQVGILHVDLDHFKEINDTHGHSAGDRALEHAAAMLVGALRTGDLVARVGGDEFIVICPGMPDLAALESTGRALAAAIRRPFVWRDVTLSCQASIGCALADPGCADSQTLLLQSDFALYEAKRSGRGRIAAYDERLHQRHMRAQRRSADLREAVEIGALDHLYQPVLDLRTGQIAGFETLVRWQHETEGLIAPRDFLPLAAELGLMAKLDLASMEAALEAKHRLAAGGFRDVSMSFNASSDLLRHPSFINRLVFGAEAAGMDRHQIAIEVLETTVFADEGEGGSPARIIRDLRDAGFEVFLDDFGMGYAGLAHLAELAITGIKIDKALVNRIMTNDTSAKIVATIIELCRDLGLKIIAEGVEDAATADRLRTMGCPMIQGYWLSPPIRGELVPDFLRGHGAAPATARRGRRPRAAAG
ncbi:MAG: EAL domain-containing protein [Rhodobacterales bacterium]|nr:EAL domain-containing protein [Rhodobacterales bacterium]